MAKRRISKKVQRPTFIRQWRKHRGLTLEQLAERVEMSAGALSLLERGISQYTQETLEALADALGTTPASLLNRDPAASDAPWSILDNLEKAPPEERRRIIAVVETMLKTGTE